MCIAPGDYAITTTTTKIICYCRQWQLEAERERRILELLEAKERQKREKEENKIRRIQLSESTEHFGSM